MVVVKLEPKVGVGVVKGAWYSIHQSICPSNQCSCGVVNFELHCSVLPLNLIIESSI